MADEPQFSGASPEEEPAAREPSKAPVPPARALELMAAHRQAEHEDDFQLERDLYLGPGPRSESQHLTYDPARASFSCRLCRGFVYPTGELTPEMVEQAQRFDQGLQPHLAGLHDRADRDEMTRRYLDGSLNREQLRKLRRPAASRRARTGSRPEVAERRSRAQAWMLEQYVELGSLERVLDRAGELQREDPDAWLRIAFRPLSRETLRKYWADIEPAAKEEALARYKERPR